MKEKTSWQELRGTLLFVLLCTAIVFAADMTELKEVSELRPCINISYIIMGVVLGVGVGFIIKD